MSPSCSGLCAAVSLTRARLASCRRYASFGAACFLGLVLGVRAAQRSIGALPPCWPPVPDGEPMALWPESAAEALSFLPLLCVLFVCHFNVLGAHAALSTPTWARATASVDLAVLASSALYVAFGLSGFALARASTPGDILTALPVDDPAAALARGLLLLTLLAACPIACVPCRAALWRLLRLGFLPRAPATVATSQSRARARRAPTAPLLAAPSPQSRSTLARSRGRLHTTHSASDARRCAG